MELPGYFLLCVAFFVLAAGFILGEHDSFSPHDIRCAYMTGGLTTSAYYTKILPSRIFIESFCADSKWKSALQIPPPNIDDIQLLNSSRGYT